MAVPSFGSGSALSLQDTVEMVLFGAVSLGPQKDGGPFSLHATHEEKKTAFPLSIHICGHKKCSEEFRQALMIKPPNVYFSGSCVNKEKQGV